MSDALSIRLTPAMRRELERFCKDQRRAVSDVAREALRRYLAAEQLRRLREKLRPHAQSAGFVTDDDVFKAVS